MSLRLLRGMALLAMVCGSIARAGSVQPSCPPDTTVSAGSTAQLFYRATNADTRSHSVRAFPEGDRSWARSPGIVDPLFLAPGGSVSWIVTVPDTATPGVVRVPFRVLWDGGEDSCVNLVTIVASTTTAPHGGALSLGIPHPQPAHRTATAIVTVELPDAITATLDTFDAAGRRLTHRVLTGPGRRDVSLAELRAAPPGRYALVLAGGARRVTRSVILLP